MQIEKFIAILRRYLQGNSSTPEKEAVDQWYEEKDQIDNPVQMNAADYQATRERIFKNIQSRLSEDPIRIPIYQRPAFKVAAAILLIVAIGFAVSIFTRSGTNTGIAHSPSQSLQHDVAAPQTNRAVLTLGDGTQILLDSSGNGLLASQGQVEISKETTGMLSYSGQTNVELYNMLSVPRGSKPVHLQLSDGTDVWLNVASSIRYPVSFTGTERRVEITGEAYFEVAKDAAHPFVVHKSNTSTDIRVLGTHFNVNTYDDESADHITLLEGSVQVLAESGSALLSPGQQATVNTGSVKLVQDVDLEAVMAWKDGRFYFDGASMETIMRQLEKWYDVEVSYEAPINTSFVAKISRDVNISRLLEIFELTGLVHFKIEGRKIIVMK